MVKHKNSTHGTRQTKEPLNEYGLTALQEQFCHAYLVRFNISQTERELGLKKGEGNRFMLNIKVRERINKIRVESGKAFDLTRERLLQELANIVYADMREISGKDIVDWPDEETAAVASIDYDLLGNVATVKRWNKLEAIKILNQMLGFNMPNVTKVIPANNEPISRKEIIEISNMLNEAV